MKRGNKDLKWDARTARRQAERAALHKLQKDPDSDVFLPSRNRESADPWSWD